MPKGARKRAGSQVYGLVAVALLVAVVLVIVIAGRMGGGSGSSNASSSPSGAAGAPVQIEGLQSFSNLSQDHVATPVSYPQTPPVGGPHSPIPQTCQAYTQPVPNEQAVHSMEHGAVWITYRPDLPQADVDHLDAMAGSYVLVSPFPGLPAPVVASAWGKQVSLTSAGDPRLVAFVNAFRQGPQTPEPGAICRGTTSLQRITG